MCGVGGGAYDTHQCLAARSKKILKNIIFRNRGKWWKMKRCVVFARRGGARCNDLTVMTWPFMMILFWIEICWNLGSLGKQPVPKDGKKLSNYDILIML